MKLVRVPFRITFAGGGTDQPSYSDCYGGFCVTAAIRQYMYVALHPKPTAGGNYVIRYTEVERVGRVQDISHDLVRAALRRFPMPKAEITSFADLPADCGLGSSAAFGVGLLQLLALSTGAQRWESIAELAELASKLERDDCLRPVGRQDHYACAFGAIQHLYFYATGATGGIFADAVPLVDTTSNELEDRLLLFRTPAMRDGGVRLLWDQVQRTNDHDGEMIANLTRTKELGHAFARALEAGDFPEMGRLLSEQWSLKRERSPGITTPRLDALYSTAMHHGAIGGKLVGAGGGGCFLFLADDPAGVRKAIGDECEEIPVRFDPYGVAVLADD